MVRLLLNIYTSQTVQVQWNGCLSTDFEISNGVKQGGILSPILFCVYYDELITALKRSRSGCFIGKWFVGVLAYADDLVLLAPSANAMRCLLGICDHYAASFSLSFNATKSKCMVFRPSGSFVDAQRPIFYINNAAIEFVSEWVHLGHVITTDMSTKTDITKRRNVLVGQINNLLCDFGRLDVAIKNRLFLTYCSSHYGAELWNFECESVASYAAAWRTGLRRIWGLPYTSHSNIVSLISLTLPIISVLRQRFINFVFKCLHCPNALIRAIVRHSMIDIQMHSDIVRNLFSCTAYFNFHLDQFLCIGLPNSTLRDWFNRQVDREAIALARGALECVFVRDGVFDLNGFTSAEAESFILYFSA